ncbi:LOW QUALITY PROTEIN: DUF4371 domain-containing protein, partial [Cephalotus follicularis]
IINDLGNGLFSILLDESRDVSVKEQAAVALRYLDSKECIVERFLSIVHVSDTSFSLKAAIEALFSKHSLSMSRLRGQGYDGASNMQDIFREKQLSKVIEALQNGELSSGIGSNQETSLQRADDTSWSSHYGLLIKLIATFLLDMQLQELNDRFNEVNTELLLCILCLNPNDSFSSFEKRKLIRLAEFYPSDFSTLDLFLLDNQHETYIIDMRSNSEFIELKGTSHPAERLVKTKKHIVYPLVFLLLKLALILPVATASVERAFSAMKI